MRRGEEDLEISVACFDTVGVHEGCGEQAHLRVLLVCFVVVAIAGERGCVSNHRRNSHRRMLRGQLDFVLQRSEWIHLDEVPRPAAERDRDYRTFQGAESPLFR